MGVVACKCSALPVFGLGSIGRVSTAGRGVVRNIFSWCGMPIPPYLNGKCDEGNITVHSASIEKLRGNIL